MHTIKTVSVYRLLLSLFIFSYFSCSAYGQGIGTKVIWDTLIKGHFSKEEVRKRILYVPIPVPEGATAFNMRATRSDSTKNVLDIGVFDEGGLQLGPVNGFRGWAGGVSSKQVHITKAEATPSYIPGPIHKGVWHIMLVPTNIEVNGFDWQLKAGWEQVPDTLKGFVVHPAREFINNKEGWYRGDLHMHDVNSDGVYTQAELVKASKAAGLDFMIPTNHNTNAANLNWGKYDDSSILILNGEEVTPFQENHWNAIGINPGTWIEWRYDAASGLISQYQKQVHKAGGLCVINHPFYDMDSIVDTRFPVAGFDAIEVWNGPWDKRDEYAVAWWNELLKKGIVKTAIGASDSHRPTSENKIGHPQTIVYAKGLNRNAIINGIQKGQCYIAENSNVAVAFKVNRFNSKLSASIGDTLQVHENLPLTVFCNVKGVADSSTVILISSKGIEHVFEGVSGSAQLKYMLESKDVQYIRAEVRKKDRTMQALTNPIWFRR